MASLLKQNGRYYLQFYSSRRSPARKKIALKTTRKRPAQKKRRELEDAYAEGAFDPWIDDPYEYERGELDILPFPVATERFIKSKKDKGCTKSTIRTYEKLFQLFEKIVDDLPMDQITPSDAHDFVHRSELAPASCNTRFTHIRTLFRWCRERGYMTCEPLDRIERPRQTRKFPKAVTPKELGQICEAIRADYREKRDAGWIPPGVMIWRIPMFWFALYTGLRGIELARLRWEDVSLSRRRLHVRAPKSRREETVPLSKKALAALEEVPRGEPDDFVFRAPTFDRKERKLKNFRERASYAFRTARNQAGLREGISLHGLRHGFCTLLAEAGKSAVVIKEAARHADVSTSMKYVHMANEHLKSELDDVFG